MIRRPTISDVAKLAGVSKVTVSYVLNGQSQSARISSATQEKVFGAAAHLGYTPSAIARSMVSGKSETLGVVFQHAQYFADPSDFMREVMHGVSLGAVSQGYDLLLHTKPFNDVLTEVAALTDGRVDGVLMLRNYDDETLNSLIKRGFPSVLFFTHAANAPSVDADNYQGGRLATEHLADLGHRNLGMICGHHYSTSGRERLAAFLDVLRERDLPIQPRSLLEPTPGEEVAEIREYLMRPDRPTGIFCFSDLYAFYVLKAANELGISVPDELSVVGFDSLESCEHSNPPLTSVRQPVIDIARAATELLISIVRGEPVEENAVLFPTSLDIRRSTAPFCG